MERADSAAFVTALHTAAGFEKQMGAIKVAVRLDASDFKRQMRRIEIAFAPRWIDADPPTWCFPGWGPAWRPFDWSVDT